MAEKHVNTERPNIRIQIQNNIMNSMEVDDKFSDGEEGEIIEDGGEFDDYINDSITYPSRPTEQDHHKNTLPRNDDVFPLGIDIFDKREQQKRTERAKRFALELDEINNFTEKNLNDLYSSLGITNENDNDVCFEAIHMHGVKEMDANDVKIYFTKYVPSMIEWVNSNSCNVIWSDRIAAARALYFLSKPIRGMPVKTEANGRSILLKNIDVEEEDIECTDEDQISIRDINVPIPPGSWRIGVQSMKAKNIFLRFVLHSDKKGINAEKFNVNYKHNLQNHGRLRGIMSESKKSTGIFDRNCEISTKNPWGDLAKSWKFDNREVVPEVEEDIGKANPMMQHRLGFKRSHNANEEVEEKPKIPRMRMYADEEEEKIKRRKELNVMKRLTNPVKSEPKDLRRLIRSRDSEVPNVQIVEEKDLGGRLKNRRLKFSPATQDLSEKLAQKRSDARLRINTHEAMTKQHRFREELLKEKHNSPMLRSRRSPPPKYVAEEYIDDDEEVEEIYSEEDDENDEMKTTSKVTVVIKKHKQPSVASTVWSRVKNPAQGGVKSRLNLQAKDKFEGKMRSNYIRDSHHNSTMNTDPNITEMTTDDDDDDDDDGVNKADVAAKGVLDRPGFRLNVGDAEFNVDDHKSPLRIEINNDHYHK